MIALKFGGTSVASPEVIRKAIATVVKENRQKKVVAVVFSAFGGVTDCLIKLTQMAASRQSEWRGLLHELEQRHRNAARELVAAEYLDETLAHLESMLSDLGDTLQGMYLIHECSASSKDFVMSFGERLSAYIISQAFRDQVADVAYLDARLVIRTDRAHGSAQVNVKETETLIREHFEKTSALQVTTGFIARSPEGRTTTMGRGGSDYTVSLLGAALGCEEIQIWTDVDGVLTADPRRVKNAQPVPSISFLEAMEMSHFGAKVIYPPTMVPAMRANVPIRIKNTFNPEHPGTLIGADCEDSVHGPRSISSINSVSLLQLTGSGLIGVAGISNRLFGALAKAEVHVLLISQASSEQTICFAVDPAEAEIAHKAVKDEFAYEILLGHAVEVRIEPDHAIVAVVGAGMRRQPGISGRLFGSLGRNRVNISAIAQGSSELNISLAVRKPEVTDTLNILHEAFFSPQPVTHVFLVGCGLIGATLLSQLNSHRSEISEREGLDLRVCGVANSRLMLIDENGIDPGQAKELLAEQGQPLDLEHFLTQMQHHTNTVLVDCTASDVVPNHYPEVMRQGISIVTPNKVAITGSYATYTELQALASRPRVSFYCEANVGAGLPVLSTLHNLVHSGDRIVKIEAILSGTLSYLFNTFSSGMSFCDLLRQAREKGFTEPDPRQDLSGMDVARKILILARECGHQLEMSDVEVESLIPECCSASGDVDDFFEDLRGADELFEKRRAEASAEGKVLRYIARLEEGRAFVKLEAVGPDAPCYTVSGNDNIVSFTTERYNDRPLVVRGPGAGAEVTAAQVFVEVIKAARKARLAGVWSCD